MGARRELPNPNEHLERRLRRLAYAREQLVGRVVLELSVVAQRGAGRKLAQPAAAQGVVDHAAHLGRGRARVRGRGVVDHAAHLGRGRVRVRARVRGEG